jgi:hypothetical protein
LNLPGLRVLSFYFGFVIEIVVGEAKLVGGDALFYRLLELKYVDATFVRGARQQEQSGMENDVVDVSFRVATFQFLNNLIAVGSEYFDDMTTCACRCNQSSIGIDSHCTNLGIVSWNYRVDCFVDYII